ncbi:MAG: hypothetical protein FWB91_02180 [Defluviitaleaceae bacterium]|nr:hypothetical protein [Defluviitaleaceae bacterium]
MLTVLAERELTAYDFMRCLFATLAKNKRSIINKSAIVKVIYDFQEAMLRENNHDVISMFDDIEFRKGIDENVVSYDINEVINNLQTFGVVGKLNPTYDKLFIYLTEQEADEILSQYNQEVQDTMSLLAGCFAGE